MTEEQLAQIEAGAIRLPIGAKDRKGVDICLGDSVHFADAAEWGATETPMWTVRMEGGKLPQPGSPPDLARFCEVVEADGVDPAAIVAEIRRLQADNTALRARAVPEVVWDGLLAEVGGFVLEARSGSVGWSWAIWRNGTIVSNGGGMTGGTGEQAKAACEAAFLRLVGVGS